MKRNNLLISTSLVLTLLITSCAKKEEVKTETRTNTTSNSTITTQASNGGLNKEPINSNSPTSNQTNNNVNKPKEITTIEDSTVENTTIENNSSTVIEKSSDSISSSITSTKSTESDVTNDKYYTKPSGNLKSDGEYLALDNEPIGWSHGYPVDLSSTKGLYSVGEGKVTLSFDLGYEDGYTNELLNILKEKNVKAVIFVTGTYIEQNRDLVERMKKEGHVIGNHGYDHTDMSILTQNGTNDILEDINKWEKAAGFSTLLYRAPAGKYSARGMEVLSDLGYTSLFWGLAYRDWEKDNQPDPTEALNKLKSDLISGDIILLHVFDTNIKILPDFIDYLREENLEIVIPETF